jgi:exosortase B
MAPRQAVDPAERRQAIIAWLPLIIGSVALYLPSFADIARTLWPREEYEHGPIILAIALWLLWQKRHCFLPARDAAGAPVLGSITLVLGLLLYVVGRSQKIDVLEIGSLVPVIAGLALVLRGRQALRELLFPLLFMLFLVPVPGIILQTLTLSLKTNVSSIVEQVLHWAGYPIGREGVVLTIGQYQLLVADACSGLNSMISLSAMAVLYVYLTGSQSWWRNALLIASALPIAVAVNIVRVITLVLITYHFGDEAGQGFVHNWAGILLFILGLALLFLLDGILKRLARPPKEGRDDRAYSG